MLFVPPNIGVDFICMFTHVGTFISIPPNIALAFITWSLLIVAFDKSISTLPKTASKFAPLNSFPLKFACCEPKVAQYSSKLSLFEFKFLIFLILI